MRLTELLSPERIAIAGPTPGSPTPVHPLDKAATLTALARLLSAESGVDASTIQKVLLERESLQSTGIGERVAIPHGALTELDRQWAALLIVPGGVAFESIDNQDVAILFAVVGPKRATGEHLKTLARVSRVLRSRDFREQLVAAHSPQEAFDLIASEEGGLK